MFGKFQVNYEKKLAKIDRIMLDHCLQFNLFVTPVPECSISKKFNQNAICKLIFLSAQFIIYYLFR